MCSKKRSCFTLLEILVVISVIVILMGSVAGIASYVTRKNADARTLATVEMLRVGLEQYKTKYGFYPPSVQVQANGYIPFHLDKINSNGVSDNFNQFVDYNQLTQTGRSRKVGDVYEVLDGYGEPIYYRCPGYVNKTSFDLGSLGADGKLGDNSDKALNSSDSKDYFGKGDDITNCHR